MKGLLFILVASEPFKSATVGAPRNPNAQDWPWRSRHGMPPTSSGAARLVADVSDRLGGRPRDRPNASARASTRTT